MYRKRTSYLKRNLYTIAGVLLGVLAFGFVGEMDYQDALLAEQEYCESVREGRHPDYDGIYRDVCLDLNGSPKQFPR